jgi:hypothetical protein
MGLHLVYNYDEKLWEFDLGTEHDHVHKSFPICAQMIFT